VVITSDVSLVNIIDRFVVYVSLQRFVDKTRDTPGQDTDTLFIQCKYINGI